MINFTQSYFKKWVSVVLDTAGFLKPESRLPVSLMKGGKALHNIKKQVLLLMAVMFLGVQAEAQYCTPTINTCDELISNVTLNTINNNSSGCGSTTGYDDFTSISTLLNIGATYTMTVTVGPNVYSGDAVDVWIDYNHNNTFDGSELLTTITGYGYGSGTHSSNITIPTSALTGNTRLRARLRYNGSPDPCANFSYGQAEDYTVDLEPLPPCSGTPATTSISPTGPVTVSPCTSSIVTLTASGSTVASGIHHIWQQSTDGGVTWANVTGVDTNVYVFTPSQSMKVREIDSCESSNALATASNVVDITVASSMPYATIPYTESFENWSTFCASSPWSNDQPDSNWLNSPSSGNNSWRRDDQFSTTSNSNPTFGTAYSPIASDGSHSAKFNIYWASTGSVGNLDLYVNMNAAYPLDKQISYDYNGMDGSTSESLIVYLSTDGGATFNQIDQVPSVNNSTSWTTRSVTTSTTSSTCIVRFAATSDYASKYIGLDNVKINYAPPPTPTITGNSTFCTGRTLTLTASSTASSAVYNWTGPNGFSATGATITIPNVTAAAAGTYSVTVTSYGVATSAAATKTVTINPTPIFNSGLPSGTSPVCKGDLINLSATTTPAATSYTWTGPNGFSTSAQNPSFTSSLGANGTYQVYASLNGCVSDTPTVNIIVHQVPNITAITPSNPTACGTANGSITLTVNLDSLSLSGNNYTVNYTKNNIAQTPVVLTSDASGNVTITGLGVGVYDNFTAMLNGCTSLQAGPTVLSDIGAPAVPTAATDTPCAGGTLHLTANSSTPGVSYSWVGPNSFTSGTQNPSISSITTAAAGTYYVVATLSGCQSAAGTVQSTINVSPSIIINVPDTTICEGNNASFTVDAGGTITGYQWQVNTGSGFTNITNNSTYGGATTTTLSITGATAGMNGYTYQCIVSGPCSPNAISNAATLTVNTAPVITSNISNASVCVGSNKTLTLAATGTSLTYQWQVNTGGGFANINNNSTYGGATTASLTITGATTALNGNIYKCIVSGVCNPSVTSAAATLTINTLPAVTTQPVSSTICGGNNTSFTVAASGTALTYQWQVNSGSGFTNVSNNSTYSGATTATLNISSTTAGMNGYLYQCVVSGTCSPSVTTNSVVLVVNTSPAISGQPANAAACPGGNTFFQVTASGSGLSYQWQADTGTGYNNISNGGAYSGASTSILYVNNVTTSMNNYKFRCVVSGTCTPSTTSNGGTLTISSAPAISTVPLNKVVCAGSNTTFNIAASGAGLTYQWQVSAGGAFTNITNNSTYSGAATSTLSITGASISMNGYRYKCVVTGSCSPLAVSGIDTLTVNSLPAVTSQPSSSSICVGNSTLFTISATGTGITYQWQVNDGSGFTNVANNTTYNGATSSTLSITAADATMNGYQYRCVVSGACTPSANSTSATLTVNAPPSVTTQPADTIVCQGNAASFTVGAAGASLTYQWQVNTGSGFTNIANGSVYSGATTATLAISAATATMNGYTYQCILSGTCTPVVSSNPVTLTVNTLPVIANQPTATSVCDGSNTTIALVATGTALTYQWEENSGSGFTALSDGGVYSGTNTSALTITGAQMSMDGYQYRCIVSGICSPSTTSSSMILTVNPLPLSTINASGPTLICPADSVGLTANSGAGLTYQWQMNGNDITGASSITYYANAVGTYHAVVTNANGCSATSNDISVTHLAAPPSTAAAAGPTTFCQGGTVLLYANSTPGLIYYWQLNGAYISGATNVNYTANVSGSYRVITYDGVCYQPSAPVIVTVDPQPTATITYTGSGTICQGSSLLLQANTGNNLTYQWQLNGNNISGATSATYNATTTGNYSVVVNNLGGCNNTATAVPITVNPAPTATIAASGSTNICSNDSLTLTANSGSGLSYQWQMNNSDIPGATALSLTVVASGSYSVAVTDVNDGCTTVSSPLMASVVPAPQATINTGGISSLCTGSTLTLTANTGTGLSYQWIEDGANIAGATASTYPATSGGNYAVAVSNSGCTTISPSLTLTLLPAPQPVITQGGYALCTNGTYVTYQWYKNGQSIPDAVNNCYIMLSNGVYSVNVTDANGCSKMSANDTVENLAVINVSGKETVKIYPNPATDVINIDAPQTVNVTISSLDGKMLIQQNDAKRIDIHNLANAVYMIRVYNADGELLKIDKLIKNGW